MKFFQVGQQAVEGHFKGDYPWMYSHDKVSKQMAHIVGAKEDEVVIMNTLTVNLHLALVSLLLTSEKINIKFSLKILLFHLMSMLFLVN